MSIQERSSYVPRIVKLVPILQIGKLRIKGLRSTQYHPVRARIEFHELKELCHVSQPPLLLASKLSKDKISCDPP